MNQQLRIPSGLSRFLPRQKGLRSPGPKKLLSRKLRQRAGLLRNLADAVEDFQTPQSAPSNRPENKKSEHDQADFSKSPQASGALAQQPDVNKALTIKTDGTAVAATRSGLSARNAGVT
jgi:hypothetical protein